MYYFLFLREEKRKKRKGNTRARPAQKLIVNWQFDREKNTYAKPQPMPTTVAWSRSVLRFHGLQNC